MSLHFRVGVTLTEVVYALIIIAFVAAVLFPIFQHPISNNPRTSCASNMKQLGLALTQYEQDADENFPAGTNPAGNGWAGELYPFTNSTGVYRCPDDTEKGKFISYAENHNLVKQNANSLARPGVTVELYEFTTLNCDPAALETNSAVGISTPQDSKRHDGSTFNSTYSLNFLTVDGHVKYLTPRQVSGGPNAIRPKALPKRAYVETFAIK